MDKKDLLKLLDNVSEQGQETIFHRHSRVLVIDGLNLFFRNFAMLNLVNPDGIHVGGLGGFFRSLGALIRQIEPTSVYVVFDGVGSSNNRKNLLPEYKSGRNLNRITNWEVFDNLDEEDDAKVGQIIRIIQYLKTLPVKVISLDKVEADDIIAHLSTIIPSKPEDKFFIVSSDKDFLQLINDNVIVYSPIIKEFYNSESVKEKFGILPHNFLLYKTLMGDSSDKVEGVKGLGPKKLFKLFPELTQYNMSLQDIFDISEKKLKENVIYARILHSQQDIERNCKIMDLSNPMLDDQDKKILKSLAKQTKLQYLPEEFLRMYHDDQLGGVIRNVEFWIKDVFQNLNSYNK